MSFPIISNVTISEWRKEARKAIHPKKNGSEVLVDGLAVSIVGHDMAEELVEEDNANGEELDEVP